jgi:hypothetical protein
LLKEKARSTTCLFAASFTGAWWERHITSTVAAFTTFDDKNHYLMGGTGKYKGITGIIPYTVVGLHETVGGRTAWIVNHKAIWEIK